MALWKRGGTWWTQVWVNGVRHAKSTHTSRVREAREIDRQFKEELMLAQYHAHRLQPEMPFGELAARFLAEAGPKPHHVDRLKILLPYFIYTHVELPMKRDAIRKLEEWVARQRALAEKESQSIDNNQSDQRQNAGDALRARPQRE